MVFWSLAIAIAALTCAVLYFASRRKVVNARPDAGRERVLATLLAEINADEQAGRIGAQEAQGARAELAREAMRIEADGGEVQDTTPRWLLPAGCAALLAVSFGTYAVLGRPEMPTMPLAGRPEIAARDLSLDDAVAQIEARLAVAPDDARAWRVLTPAYREMGRFDDAAEAVRNVIRLEGRDPELLTDLAEILIVAADGSAEGEPMTLLSEVLAANPDDARALFYLANEQTRTEDFAGARESWSRLIELAGGDAPWLDTARRGLAFAEAEGAVRQPDPAAIAAMVTSLDARLMENGGTIEDWTQLVRSYLVLGDMERAQAVFNAAFNAYPEAADRGSLDTIALAGGLQMPGSS
jgi:cytochrome c-type biogenesis protein CcmH